MASERRGWFRRLLGRGSGNGNGSVALEGKNGNGAKLPASAGSEVRILAKRTTDRERSALIIQEGIRDLSGLLKGIETRLETQNEQGRQVGDRLEHLAETMHSLPAHGEKSEEILGSIQDEVKRQAETSREVVGYFKSIPQILSSLEAGGSVRKTQIELARGLVREVAFQRRSTAQMAGAMEKLSNIGEEQLACLKGVQEGIRSGFETAGHVQSAALQEWKRRSRWTVIGGISFLAVAILVLGAGIFINLNLTHGVLGEILAAPAAHGETEQGTAAPEPTGTVDAPILEAPAPETSETMVPDDPETESLPEFVDPSWSPWFP